jgi:hypothetical protein
LTMTWEFTEERDQPLLIIQRVFLPYTGLDASGNATFGLVTDRFVFGPNVELLSLLVRKSGDQWLLEVLTTGGRGSQIRVIAQSADLYEGWIGLADGDFELTLENITATCGDQTYRQLCITSQSEDPFGTFTNISGGIEAIIPEISEEYPAGYGGSRPYLFWETKASRWSVSGTVIEDADDISQPPTGQFITEGGAVTIVEGQCTGEVPTPPGPTLVTTTDIQVSTTLWNWTGLSATGQSAGSIGPFLIDGQSGAVNSGLIQPGAYSFQVNGPIAPGNTYQVTLLPSASAQALVSIGFTSYNLVSMILNITALEGTSPIGQAAGIIANISGTITYEESTTGSVLPPGPVLPPK